MNNGTDEYMTAIQELEIPYFQVGDSVIGITGLKGKVVRIEKDRYERIFFLVVNYITGNYNWFRDFEIELNKGP